MTTINWIKCSDRMPPDDKNMKLILKDANGVLRVRNSSVMNLFYRLHGIDNYEWIPYDEMTWKDLNNV